MVDSARPTVMVLLGDELTEITDPLGPHAMFARVRIFNVITTAPKREPQLLSGGFEVTREVADRPWLYRVDVLLRACT